MWDETHADAVVGSLGGQPLTKSEALALIGLTPPAGAPAIGASLPEHVRRMFADLVCDVETAVIDALFPTAHDWEWQGDTLTVLHTEPGHAVRDVWYRRGEVLYLETRVAVARG